MFWSETRFLCASRFMTAVDGSDPSMAGFALVVNHWMASAREATVKVAEEGSPVVRVFSSTAVHYLRTLLNAF